MTKKPGLQSILKKVFALLKKVEPAKDAYDIFWYGPYFIPKAKNWASSLFKYYNGYLYCQLIVDGYYYNLDWKVNSSELRFENDSLGPYYNNEYLWAKALAQIEKKLERALNNPEKYNRHVNRFLPLNCRTGKILRHYTWPKGRKSILPKKQIEQLEQYLQRAKKLPKLDIMTANQYLEVVAIAYNVGFKELRPLSPLEKYQRKADGRHGGLLDIPPNDPKAFEEWYHSGRWSGSHPWEIVFGHPHGIMLAPYQEDHKKWFYLFWVDSLGWYVTASKMALALGAAKIPFEFRNGKEVVAVLKGIDEVEVSSAIGFEYIHFDELIKDRPDAIAHIKWDEIPPILPVSPEQKARIATAELKADK